MSDYLLTLAERARPATYAQCARYRLRRDLVKAQTATESPAKEIIVRDVSSCHNRPPLGQVPSY